VIVEKDKALELLKDKKMEVQVYRDIQKIL
jgi:hypothetical protein